MRSSVSAIKIIEVVALALAVGFFGYVLASFGGDETASTASDSQGHAASFIVVNAMQVFISAYLGHRILVLFFKNEELERYQQDVLRGVTNIMGTDSSEAAATTTKQFIMNIVGDIPKKTTRQYLDRVEDSMRELFDKSNTSFEMGNRVGTIIDYKLKGEEVPMIDVSPPENSQRENKIQDDTP